MAVYNGERWLREAVESVLAQDLEAFELIVVDDGSGDSSPEILAHYAGVDKRVRVIRQANSGQASALNAGLEVARGCYTAFMDADDESCPSRLRVQKQFLDDHPQVGAVGCGVEVIDEHGRRIGKMSAPRGPDRCKSRLFRNRYYSLGGALLVRTAWARKIGGFRSPFRWNDLDFMLRFAERYEIDCVPDTLYRYRIHPDQESIALKQRGAWEMRLIYDLHHERMMKGVDDLQRGGAVAIPDFQDTSIDKRSSRKPTIGETLAYIHLGELELALEERRIWSAVLSGCRSLWYVRHRRKLARSILALVRNYSTKHRSS